MLSAKERRRLAACARIRDGSLTISAAAGVLGITTRQMRRSFRRYQDEGDDGLVHKLRGRASNKGLDPALKAKVLERYRERYPGFGPTLAAEKLAKDGLVIDHETLRRVLSEEGDWTARPRRVKHRKARERMHHFGELIQFDGSPHDWFEGRRERCCVMQMIDDATGLRLMRFCEHESTADAMELLAGWIRRYGVPKALYTDRAAVYVTSKGPTIEEQLEAVVPATAFGMSCDMLGIRLIRAYSPQAKGRVERANGVAQDRLVKELRLEGVSTIEAANALLEEGYLDELNCHFSVPPASECDFHRALQKGEDLTDIFSVRERRSVANDFTIRYQGTVLQILKQPGLPRPGEGVTVACRLDGMVRIEHKGRHLAFEDVTEKLAARRPKEEPERPVGPRRQAIPGPDHPWKRGLPSTMPGYAAAMRLANHQGRTFLSSP